MTPADHTDARWRARRIAARLAYAAVILVATWAGLRFDGNTFLAGMRLWRALHPDVRPMDVVDGVRNVALFAGFGGVWVVTANPARLGRAIVGATVAGLALSLVAEALQLFSPTRMASVLDLATNAGGALLGGALVAYAIAVVARRRARGPEAVVPHLLVAGPYLSAALLEAFSAWGRPDRVPGVWGGFGPRWRASVAELLRAGPAAPAWSDVLLFAPAGFLATRVLFERGLSPARAGALAAVLAALAWGGAEVARGLSGADMQPWSVALRTVASALGALAAATLAGRARPAAPGWLAGLHRDARVYVALIALWTLRPFVPNSPAAALAKITPDTFVPMRALFQLWSLHSVADVVIGFCLFLPVGAWLAVHPRPDGRRRAPWGGLALAAAAEVAQLGVAARHVDVTDVLVQGAGVLVGWAIVLRADARRRGAPALAAQSALGNVSGGSSLGASAARSSGSTARVASK